jgi:hypothetical protein
MGQVFLLSLAAALNPVLLAASTVMLLLPNPKRLMLDYLLGALMTRITLGLVIVYALKGSGVVSTTQNTISPGSIWPSARSCWSAPSPRRSRRHPRWAKVIEFAPARSWS